MVAASFATLFLWLAFLMFVCTILAMVADWQARRERERRLRRLRERRRYLDQRDPQRWTT